MAEEVLVHEAVVAFGMVFGDANIFVHVEGHDVFEGDAAGFVGFDEQFVDAFWTASCGQAEDEGTVFSGGEVIYALFVRVSCQLSSAYELEKTLATH